MNPSCGVIKINNIEYMVIVDQGGDPISVVYFDDDN